MNQIFTLASSFITSCPHTNFALPVAAFPALTSSPANAPSGTSVTYDFTDTSSDTYYAIYYSGLDVFTAKLDSKKKATVPGGLLGRYYTIIVSCLSILLLRNFVADHSLLTQSTSANATDATTVAGPLISVVDFLAISKKGYPAQY